MTGSILKQSGPPIPDMIEGLWYNIKPSNLPFQFTFRNTPGRALYAYYSGYCLMSLSLVETLQAAGVDNLQTFPAVLSEETTGEVREDYCVVNILGLVAAADMQQSDAISLGGGQVFSSLEVDKDKAKKLLFFRLAESLTDVIVHEKVAKAIEVGEFPGVVLTSCG